MKTEDWFLLGGGILAGYFIVKQVTGKDIFQEFGKTIGETAAAATVGTAGGVLQGSHDWGYQQGTAIAQGFNAQPTSTKLVELGALSAMGPFSPFGFAALGRFLGW